MRTILAAFALSAFTFFAGVLGDLSDAPASPNSGTSVTLRIPPELPPDTPRAAPLPLATAPAAASTPRAAPAPAQERARRVEAPLEAPAQAAEAAFKPNTEQLVRVAEHKGEAEGQPDPRRREVAAI